MFAEREIAEEKEVEAGTSVNIAELENLQGELETLHGRCDHGLVRLDEVPPILSVIDQRARAALPIDTEMFRLYDGRMRAGADWWHETVNGYVAREDCRNIGRRIAILREILNEILPEDLPATTPTMLQPVTEFRPGLEIERRYVIHSHIGAGGYASVWRASDKQLNRDVAIKRFLRKSIGVSDFEEEAVGEGRKSAQLVHPNIAQVFDIVQVGSPPEHLIVMEFVDGPSLLQVLREKAKRAEVYPLDQGMTLLREILTGVAHAHSKGICHRDLTPLNILISSAGSPKIVDFGIARALRDSKAPGEEKSTAQAGTGTRCSWLRNRRVARQLTSNRISSWSGS